MKPENRKNDGARSLAGRLNMAGWRKHYVAAMTADEEEWPQRERTSGLGRIFIIVLLLHLFIAGAVVLYNIISPKTAPIARVEAKPVNTKSVSTAAAVNKGAPQPKAAPPAPAAAKGAPAPASASDDTATYEVKTGDNLPGIAAALGVNAEELVKMNDLDKTDLFPGRRIVYSKKSVVKPAAAAPVVAPAPAPAPKIAAASTPDKKNTVQQAKSSPPATEKTEEGKADALPKATLIKTPDPADQPPATKPAPKDDTSSPPPAKPKTETKPKTEAKAEPKSEPAKSTKTASKSDKSEKAEKASRDTSGRKTYVTTSKDTLYSISRRFGVKVETLMKVNGIKDPTLLRDGTKLIIPSKG